MQPFQAVVTLGGWCRVTAQARRWFGYTTAYPFDWLILPTPGLFTLLETDFRDFLKPEFLRLRADLDGVTCTRHGLQHKHDFLRDENHMTLPEWEGQLETARSKYAHRRRNFDALGSLDRVLFIRHDDLDVFKNHDEPDDGFAGDPATEKNGEQLLALLQDRFPSTRSTLLCVDFAAPDRSSEGLIFDHVVDHGDGLGDYRGGFRGWDEMFARHDLRMAPDVEAAPELTEVSDVNHGYW